MHRRIIQMTLGALLLCFFVLWSDVTWYPWFHFQQFELPSIQQEVAKLSGVSIIGVYEGSGGPDEYTPIMLLRIAPDKELALYLPTRASFTGGGDVIIWGIGACRQSELLFVSHPSRQPNYPIYATVSDVIAHYDAIYEEARRSRVCLPRAAYGTPILGQHP